MVYVEPVVFLCSQISIKGARKMANFKVSIVVLDDQSRRKGTCLGHLAVRVSMVGNRRFALTLDANPLAV